MEFLEKLSEVGVTNSEIELLLWLARGFLFLSVLGIILVFLWIITAFYQFFKEWNCRKGEHEWEFEDDSNHTRRFCTICDERQKKLKSGRWTYCDDEYFEDDKDE